MSCIEELRSRNGGNHRRRIIACVDRSANVNAWDYPPDARSRRDGVSGFARGGKGEPAKSLRIEAFYGPSSPWVYFGAPRLYEIADPRVMRPALTALLFLVAAQAVFRNSHLSTGR
jgi:hypothetical protein